MHTDRELLLVAGYPGTGKSHVCSVIHQELGPFTVLSLDDVKEELYDREGFVDRSARDHLDRAALELFLARMRRAMSDGERVLAEYPFSDKQKDLLAAACRHFAYWPVTVRLVADFEVLYQRQRRRDLQPDRHLGHLVDAYRPGDTLADRRNAPQLLTLEVYLDRYLHRGYGSFALGEVLEVDTTDFALVDDDALIARLRSMLSSERTRTLS